MNNYTTQPFEIPTDGTSPSGWTLGYPSAPEPGRPFICPWILADIIYATGGVFTPKAGDVFTLTFWDEAPPVPAYSVWIKRFAVLAATFGPTEGNSNFFPYAAMSKELLSLLPLAHDAKRFWVTLNAVNATQL
jgi:hypothetical protein